jgi:hypothetical protein
VIEIIDFFWRMRFKMSKKSTESYEKLGLYISNDSFTFDISNGPTIEEFEKELETPEKRPIEKTTLVAKCVLNTEEYFPLNYKKNGELAKKQREYHDPDDEDYDGKKVDYISVDPYWTDKDNEWLYCLAYNGHIVKIGMTITSLHDRYGSYSCGTGRAMKKGSCSTTNFIVSECNSLALEGGYEVEIYGIALPKKTVIDDSWGLDEEIVVSIARGMETKLMGIYTNAYSKKPVLCVQEGK